MARVPVALDQRAADEQVAREDRVDRAVGDRAAGDDRQAVERDPLGGDDRRALAAPSAARRSVRRIRCSASGSTQRGSIRAAVRPHSRDVSTSSATITQLGWPLTPLPGQSAKRAPRAPR